MPENAAMSECTIRDKEPDLIADTAVPRGVIDRLAHIFMFGTD